MSIIKIQGYDVKITNPEKLLWPELGIRKIDLIQKLIELAPFIIPHARNRLLTTIRYPDGVEGKSFYQKNIPPYSPDWVATVNWHENDYIVLNNTAILAWLGNQAALELHTAFNYCEHRDFPTSLVFDLDPSAGVSFEQTSEAALHINEALNGLQVKSYIKTSGATGLQIYIPIGKRYDYQTARKINEFFAIYFSQKYPKLITVERSVSKRGQKIYFDYLQMWSGKSIITAYSPRATKEASVSTPLEWDELMKGIHPSYFTLLNILDRLSIKGDLFEPLLHQENEQNLDLILEQLKTVH